MRGSTVFLSIALAIGACLALSDGTSRARPAPGPIETGDVVILNGQVFDGTGGPPIEDGLVAVRGERIVARGPRGDFALPEGAEVIDAGGGFIMPGVIDSHVHLFESLFAGFDVLTPWLQAGVTTIRDLGNCVTCVPIMRQFIESVAEDPPRVVISGASITSPGGPLSDNPTLGLVVSSEEEARAAVADMLDIQGADLIKLYNPEMPLAMSQAIVEEAHARGKRVSSHPDGLVSAIAAGVDDFAHPPFTEVTDEVLQQAADQGIEMNSTLFGHPDPVLARYRDLGGVIAMGTDVPPNGQPGCQLPVYEMRDMIDSGLTPNEVLVASTKNAAIVSNLGTELGTLEVGKIADIIVVDGDPLTDISVMENVSLVMKGGRLVDLTPHPTHNQFASAEPIGALPFDDTASFYCADREEGEPTASCVGPEPRTVWYRLTPELNALIIVDLTRPVLQVFDSAAFAVGVYAGPTLDSLTEVACGNEEITFPAEAGTTYYLQLHALVDFTAVFSTGSVHVESASALPVSGIAMDPDVAEVKIDPSGLSYGVIAGAVAAVGAALTLVGAAWYARRRWLR